MEESNKDKIKEAYNISNYDLIYILLKPAAHLSEGYQGFVKFDKARNKWFLIGKVIEAEGYPKYQILPLVPEKDLYEYKKTKKFADKKKYILNIHFSHIDFITLPFDNLDWKR